MNNATTAILEHRRRLLEALKASPSQTLSKVFQEGFIGLVVIRKTYLLGKPCVLTVPCPACRLFPVPSLVQDVLIPNSGKIDTGSKNPVSND